MSEVNASEKRMVFYFGGALKPCCRVFVEESYNQVYKLWAIVMWKPRLIVLNLLFCLEVADSVERRLTKCHFVQKAAECPPVARSGELRVILQFWSCDVKCDRPFEELFEYFIFSELMLAQAEIGYLCKTVLRNHDILGLQVFKYHIFGM